MCEIDLQLGLLSQGPKPRRLILDRMAGQDAKARINGLAVTSATNTLADNIPGVTGVGPKTATDLLRQFGSLEEIYRRLGEIKSDRLRINLQAASELVWRNRKLICPKKMLARKRQYWGAEGTKKYG